MSQRHGNWILILLAALSLCLSACSKGSGGEEPKIRSAIQARLTTNTNLNMAAFDTDIKQVTITGDTAQAQVDFKVKGGTGTMQLTYRLAKQGGNWVVLDSNGASGDASHQSAEQPQMPGAIGAPALPPPGASHSLSDSIRSFQQGTPDAAPPLPPGHPAVQQNQQPQQ